jgi:sugar-specific transcriptional regulator TrmB
LANSSEFIDVLKRLGLTLNEARVFYALCGVGKTTAKSISRTSGIAREVVYQVLPSLQKKGLVEEIITSPKSFRALLMEDAFETLLRRRNSENVELKEKARKTLESWQNANRSDEETQIVVLLPREDDSRWRAAWEKAKETVDLIMPLAKFLQWPRFYAEPTLDEAIRKNLKLRIVTDVEVQEVLLKPPEGFSSSLITKFNRANFKFMTISPRVELAIFDRKTCFVCTNKVNHMKDMTWLLTNNSSIVEMATTYFEAVWLHPTKLAELFAW